MGNGFSALFSINLGYLVRNILIGDSLKDTLKDTKKMVIIMA